MDHQLDTKKFESEFKKRLLMPNSLSKEQNELLQKISSSMKLKFPNMKNHKGGSKKSRKNKKRKTQKRTKRK